MLLLYNDSLMSRKLLVCVVNHLKNIDQCGQSCIPRRTHIHPRASRSYSHPWWHCISEVEEQDSHLVCLLFTLWPFLCLVTFLMFFIIGIFRMASNLDFNVEPNTETVNFYPGTPSTHSEQIS